MNFNESKKKMQKCTFGGFFHNIYLLYLSSNSKTKVENEKCGNVILGVKVSFESESRREQRVLCVVESKLWFRQSALQSNIEIKTH